MNFNFPIVIADIGGTNARFMLINDAAAEPIMGPTFKLKDYALIEDAFNAAISLHFKVQPHSIVMALASPIFGDEFHLTNANWTVRPDEFLGKTGAKSVYIMNDFAAQGLGAIAATDDDLYQIGGNEKIEALPKVVIGPGTGLGIVIAVPNIINDRLTWSLLPGEGGHMDLGPITPRENTIWPNLRKQDGRMEAELAVSGQGLENIYQAIATSDGLTEASGVRLSAPQITERYKSTGDATCEEAIRLMATFLARVAADLAILTMPKGGVYLTGGITKHVKSFIREDNFRNQFENKAPFTHLMKEIPIFIMENEQPALDGLSSLVLSSSSFNLDNAVKQYHR